MSVYIKGRKPPNSCDDCWVSDCPNDEHIDGYRMMDRPTYCPLIPVPEHGRLIDADALIADIQPTDEDANTGADLVLNVFLGVLKAEPTIIPADKEGETRSNTSNALDALNKEDDTT